MSLQAGSQGKAVADVQQALRRHGFVAADRAGVFSGNTAKAVREFQNRDRRYGGVKAAGGTA